jgi:hypothetical protein
VTPGVPRNGAGDPASCAIDDRGADFEDLIKHDAAQPVHAFRATSARRTP